MLFSFFFTSSYYSPFQTLTNIFSTIPPSLCIHSVVILAFSIASTCPSTIISTLNSTYCSSAVLETTNSLSCSNHLSFFGFRFFFHSFWLRDLTSSDNFLFILVHHVQKHIVKLYFGSRLLFQASFLCAFVVLLSSVYQAPVTFFIVSKVSCYPPKSGFVFKRRVRRSGIVRARFISNVSRPFAESIYS